MSKIYTNLYYFRVISRIGGTEQFLYEVAKKYHKYDITVLYDETDLDQLARLQKLVRCIRREPGKTYRAKRAFYNFNLEALPQIEADEHIFICHAIYQEIPQIPPLNHPKLTRWIGVSKYACSELERYGEALGKKIKAELCYNPLTLEKPDKVMRLISACRLDDEVKGGKRTLRLIKALDDYCEKTGKHYLWTIYTNNVNFKINSPNVILMKPRPDVRPFIADSDWLLQLSNDMESYCYSMNEALSYGVRIVRTPFSVAKELKIPKDAELVLDYDCKNVDKIAEKIFEPAKDFTYKPPKDGWEDFLIKEPSNYTPNNNVYVQCINDYYDLELQKQMVPYSEPFKVTFERANKLCRTNKFCRVVTIDEEEE